MVEIEKERKANEMDILEKRKKEEMERHQFLKSRKWHDKDMKSRLVKIPEYIPVWFFLFTFECLRYNLIDCFTLFVDMHTLILVN